MSGWWALIDDKIVVYMSILYLALTKVTNKSRPFTRGYVVVHCGAEACQSDRALAGLSASISAA